MMEKSFFVTQKTRGSALLNADADKSKEERKLLDEYILFDMEAKTPNVEN